MKIRLLLCLPALGATLSSGAAGAVDGMAFEFGSGNGADMGRIGVQWDWKKRWLEGPDWHVGGYWDLALGQWRHGDLLPGQNGDITEIGLTPVFRLQQNDRNGLFVEAAVGFHLLSRTSFDSKRFSTSFQFGDHLGLGYRFGSRGEYELAYRIQHMSNADIKRPNDGINFNQIRFQYHF